MITERNRKSSRDFPKLAACYDYSRVPRATNIIRLIHKLTGKATPNTNSHPGKMLIGFGSQNGFAESMAWRSAKLLREVGWEVQVTRLNDLELSDIAQPGGVIFITSTTGHGEAPDNAKHFHRFTMRRRRVLEQTRFALLALGDSSYREFCGFGMALERWLLESGAQPIDQTVKVDNADPKALEQWRTVLRTHFSAPETGQLAQPYAEYDYSRWILTDRDLLNPGSSAPPLYHLTFKAMDPPPLWSAGDLAAIFPGPAGRAIGSSGQLAPRKYSIACLPDDGQLEIVIRQRTGSDGTVGIGSSWLTREADIGDRIALNITRNRGVPSPCETRALILIGSGSGIAGLRAHLKQRIKRGQHQNWLIYGERNADSDQPFAQELEFWRKAGKVERLDLVYSRDQQHKVYAQDVLKASSDSLKDWIRNGASIYVCGSQKGFGESIHNALISILGKDDIDSLIEENRYSRDVY